MKYLLGSAIALSVVVSVVGAPVERSATEAGTIYGGAIADLDWGRPITSGDLDGDGYDEVVVAASESFGGVISRVYVLRGGPGAHGLGSIDLTTSDADQVILGAAVDDNLGASMATGDMNGDGVDELILCASSASFSGVDGRGIAYVIYGGADFFDEPVRDLADTANWDMRVLGPVAFGDMGGANLFGGLDAHGAAVGRLNDDVYGDLVLGVHLADGAAAQAGRVYVVPGGPWPSGFTRNLAVPGSYLTRIDGRGNSDELGTVVLTGDLTGDGIDELILPNEYASQGLFTTEGAVHIFRGRETWFTFHSLGASPADITLLGDFNYDKLGAAAVAGDFDGDGVTDLAAAAPGADAGTPDSQFGDGFVYGLLGSSEYQTGTHTIDYASATPDFLIVGEFRENLGVELSVGDFNADGVDDIAAAERFGGPSINGVVEVLFGRSFSPGATYEAGISTDLRIVGQAQDRIGFSLWAADVNNDGLDEVVFGTPFNNGNRGTAYVYTHVTGDADGDGDVDLGDWAQLQGCYATATWPDVGACTQFDFDLDEDVDIDDAADLAGNLVGPGF